MTSKVRGLVRFWAMLLASLLAGACCLPGQSKKPEDLAVGKLLVTPRESPDPLFAESVILLARYDANGALGLMVNRRTKVPISRALREIDSAAGHAEPVFVGGPVELDTVFGLTRASGSNDGGTKVYGDIYLVTAKTALVKALGGDTGPNRFRVYIGYCGWGPRQLENEVRRGGWYIFSQSDDAVFTGEPAKLWSKMIADAESVFVKLGWGTSGL